MTISVECPQCGKAYRVGDDKAGRKMKCKECDGVVAIPADDEFGDDDFAEVPRPGRRRNPPSANQRQSKKKGPRDTSRFTSPVQLIVGGLIVVVAAGIVFAIVKSRGYFADGENGKNDDVASNKSEDPFGPIVRDPGPRGGDANRPAVPRGRTPRPGGDIANRNATQPRPKPVINWSKYSPKNQGYTVEFPATPSVTDSKLSNGAPRRTVRAVVEKTEYGVDHTSIPELRGASDRSLNRTLERTARKMKATSVRKFQIKGIPAMAFESRSIFGSRRLHQICIVDGEFYECRVASANGDLDETRAGKFLNSFTPKRINRDDSIVTATAEQLTSEFRQNLPAAKAKYFLRTTTVTGQIVHVTSRTKSFSLLGSDGSTIYCSFLDPAKLKKARLKAQGNKAPKKKKTLKDLSFRDIRYFQTVTVTGQVVGAENEGTALSLWKCHSLKLHPYQRPGSPSKALLVLNEELHKLAKERLDEYKKRIEWRTAYPNIKKYLSHQRPILVSGVVKDVRYVDPNVSLIGLLGRVATVTLRHTATGQDVSCAMYSLDQVRSIKVGDKVQIVGMPPAIILSPDLVFDLNACSLY